MRKVKKTNQKFHKKKEKILKESEEKMKELLEKESKSAKEWQETFDAVQDMIIVISSDYRFLKINKTGYKALNKKPEEVIGKKCYEVVHGLDKPIIGCPCEESIKTKKAGIGEITERGRCYMVTVDPVFDENKELKSFVHIIKDITNHKRAEEELLFRDALLKAQSETSIDGILVVDNKGKSILFNKHFGEMWNIPQKIIDTENDEKMVKYVLNQLKKPNKFLRKIKYLYSHKYEKSRDEIEFKDGKTFDRYSSPLIDLNGKYYGRIWYFRDITERKKTEIYINGQKKALESKNIALKEVLEQITLEKTEINGKMKATLDKLIMPKLRILKTRVLQSNKKQIELIEKNIQAISSSFGKKISSREIGLSPREVEVCDMVKNGLKNNGIAGELEISVKTVETIRRNIRKKLNINNKKVNLISFLQSL